MTCLERRSRSTVPAEPAKRPSCHIYLLPVAGTNKILGSGERKESIEGFEGPIPTCRAPVCSAQTTALPGTAYATLLAGRPFSPVGPSGPCGPDAASGTPPTFPLFPAKPGGPGGPSAPGGPNMSLILCIFCRRSLLRLICNQRKKHSMVGDNARRLNADPHESTSRLISFFISIFLVVSPKSHQNT